MVKTIKNYTTDIPASKTIPEIQDLLAQSGARGIAFEYDGTGNVESLFFRLGLDLPVSPGVQGNPQKEIAFKLPAKPEAVYNILFGKAPKVARFEENRRQRSLNIAWRIMKEWLELQFTLIKLEQVEAVQLFLPYMVTGQNRTLYQDMKENQFLLPSGGGE